SILLSHAEQSRLKQTGESFIQDAACHELAAPPRCRECRSSRRKDNTTVFCRFYGFQKLSFLGDQLQTAGFCDPEDCARSDLALWLPSNQATVKSGLHPQLSSRIELDACRYILDHIGGLFCELVQQEKEALSSADCACEYSYWKRPIPGVREMCDACETTLFNLHWVCSKCGFGVCCDCYKGRRGMATEESEAYDMDKSNSFTWLKCSKGKPHIASQLIPTQIIPSKPTDPMTLLKHHFLSKYFSQVKCIFLKLIVFSVVHTLLNVLNTFKCVLGGTHTFKCVLGGTHTLKCVLGGTHTFKCVVGGTHTLYNVYDIKAVKPKPELKQTLSNPASVRDKERFIHLHLIQSLLGLKLFWNKKIPFLNFEPHPATPSPTNKPPSGIKATQCEGTSPLDLLASIALGQQRRTRPVWSASYSARQSRGFRLFQILDSLVASLGEVEKTISVTFGSNNKTHFVPICTLNFKSLESTTPSSHTWLCDRELLQLIGDCNETKTFQKHWFYGMPVVASGAEKKLTPALWKPSNISAEHGHEPTGNALINCRRGSVITNAFIRDFWNGFESIENRLTDDTGVRMILKLKDWPTTDDFLDTMPHRFKDLMAALPLPEYTSRDGTFNITSYLPNYFVRPDLGPKMYIAYGWVTEKDWDQGTTNLHLDISDACNLMVYVGIIKEGDADAAQIERARKGKPGALWHIFKASDTDKIRQLILKIKHEKGMVVPEGHDPIHDQEIYLDKQLRRRLKTEYGVEGYPIVQCEGDSVFIPAGAPHQVFNLHSCIKVAEDFVSPEHVDKCFKLTNEFRALSSTHSNHEDKLQLKNIIYHTVKELISSISWHDASQAKV
uniref:JmjC domain-containing protein n=2 Tax=Ciona savignyi TaxID=51511 RepID=H2YD03_CIOSA